MRTPLGIELVKGQKWQECDNRFTRVVTVTGWDDATGKVELNGRSKARVARFNGKCGGYKPAEKI
jgi:hypothetical protein